MGKRRPTISVAHRQPTIHTTHNIPCMAVTLSHLKFNNPCESLVTDRVVLVHNSLLLVSVIGWTWMSLTSSQPDFAVAW